MDDSPRRRRPTAIGEAAVESAMTMAEFGGTGDVERRLCSMDSSHTPSRDDDDRSDNVNETAALIVPFPLAAGRQSMMQKYSYHLTGLAFLSIIIGVFLLPLPEKIHMMNFNNDFIVDFTRALQPANTTYLSTNWPPPDGIFIVPFILKNGTLLCPPNLKEIHSINQLTRERSSHLINMINTALNSRPWHVRLKMQGLPFLALIADQNGCSVSERFDAFAYPRFSWSLPATKYGDSWCNTISVPSYSNWFSFHNENQSSWDSKLASNWREYAWSSKKNKAVWRGSTTCPPSFMGAELNETPRGKLVQMSIKYPHLIDAAFVNFVNFFKDKKDKLQNQTNVAIKRMPFEEQMAYKAIIDIDGNNWSSRFASLLCTNSVVIKIDPDYVENFYHELKPMMHYVPASLDNITQVTAYVLHKENEEEMKDIVNEANSWCRRSMTSDAMIRDMILRLEDYETKLNNYMDANSIDMSSMASLLHMNDFVDCGSSTD